MTISIDLTSRFAALAERSAVRLSHHEHIDGLTIDTYDGWLLLTDYVGMQRGELVDLAEGFLKALKNAGYPAQGAVAKARPDNLSHRQHRKQIDPGAIDVLVGPTPPTYWEVTERGMVWRVSFTEGGFSTGIFLDMVNGRQVVRDLAPTHRRVLNLFSFTGGFSIAAGLGSSGGGAQRVIEVDTHGKWLGWAQDHQKLNGVTCVRQRREDAVKFLAKQDTGSFDLIICDPPAYANPKRGERFTIESGYQTMAPHFTRVLSDGGRLLACCNHAQTDRLTFRGWLPNKLKFEKWIDPSPDFPGADYLKIALLGK